MSVVTLYDVVRRVVTTEKSIREAEVKNIYVLEVAKKATKPQIVSAVKKMFDVDVLTVRTLVQRGKVRRAGRSVSRPSNFKKAYVTLKDGQSIQAPEAKD